MASKREEEKEIEKENFKHLSGGINFDIRTLSGEKVNKGSISYKKLKFLVPRSYYITERRPV